MTISSTDSTPLKSPAQLFSQRPLPPLEQLLKASAPPAQTAAQTVSSSGLTQTSGPAGKSLPALALDGPVAGTAIAAGVWFDASRRSRDGGVITTLTFDPAQAELMPIFNDRHAPVSTQQLLAVPGLIGAINASFFANGIIGDIQAGAQRSVDDGQPALDKITDKRHFIAVAADGSVHTGLGGLSENAQAHYKHFIGGFPALYTPDQLPRLEADIRSGAFARRADYGGASQASSVSRSFLGRRADGKIVLVAAGHGSERGKGVTMSEGARLLRDLGAVEAYVLDGGGSTTMYAKGQPLARTDGRQVWSYLGVRAR